MMSRIIFFILLVMPYVSYAQIEDNNEDGKMSILAFGDSITYGYGADSINDGGGGINSYPSKLSGLLSLQVENAGQCGELLTDGGVSRAIPYIKSAKYDYILFMEGANDAIHQISPTLININLQKIINISLLNHVEPVLFTLPLPAGEHAGLRPWVAAYNQEIMQLAYLNHLKYVDLGLIWLEHGCTENACYLYNMPEGLHPNALGYQLIAESVYQVLTGEAENEGN